ncbi:LpqN/LpqT family lipoprotein [Paraoerskovia marina]|uniref:LpqN/LpqT family lipoprotein n=1 Tax=Paraoerskovia marina TaxID=545619 RepID=UPI000492B812|nr:LpqN/LpqT family lipoprotein [Paraoerskovia marina]
MRHVPRALVTASVAATVLAGCSAPVETPGTRTYDVPGSDGLTVSAPSSWTSSSVDGVYYLSSPAEVDGVRPTVVIVPGPLEGQSLDEAAGQTSLYGTEHLREWRVVDEGADTLGGFDAYRVSGEHETRGVDVVEDVVVAAIGEDEAAWVTITTAAGDSEGAAEARAVAEQISLR